MYNPRHRLSSSCLDFYSQELTHFSYACMIDYKKSDCILYIVKNHTFDNIGIVNYFYINPGKE